uniref:UDP-N-acetylglucosamine transporter TMEM241 homolog isoform X5 n=1 Tax=Pristiophorus japonicus TaxID=55135 RepID=UPI00398E5FB9
MFYGLPSFPGSLVHYCLLEVSMRAPGHYLNCTHVDHDNWISPLPLQVPLQPKGDVLNPGTGQPIPFFLVLQNASEVIASIFLKITRKEKLSFTKLLSMLMTLLAGASLPFNDLRFDPGGYFWAVIHFACAGGYKVFQKLPKSCSLSELEQQYLNYLYSVVLLISAAHPAGDALGALDFPFLYSYRFHSGCCASGILGVALLLVSVKVKSYLSTERYGVWTLFTKVLAACLSLVVFETLMNVPTSFWLIVGALGEALLVYAERSGAEVKG